MDKSLSDIYSSSVRGKRSHFYSMGSNSFSEFERDPNLIKLENSVFGKIRELTKEEEEQPIKKLPQNELKTYSVEDAIRELKELGEI